MANYLITIWEITECSVAWRLIMNDLVIVKVGEVRNMEDAELLNISNLERVFPKFKLNLNLFIHKYKLKISWRDSLITCILSK